MNWQKWLTAFLGSFFVLLVISYLMVTVFPILACIVVLMHAACTSGSLWAFIGSLVLYNGFWAVILTPFVVEYFEMKKKLKELDESDDDELSDTL